MNKRLVKDNNKSFNDCEGHSRDLMRCARHPKALPRWTHATTFTHLYQCICSAKIHSIAFTSQHSCRLIHTVLMQQHSRHTYAAALTQQHLSCSAHTALTLPHSRRCILSPLSHSSIYATALTWPHFCRSIHAAACIEPHLYCSSHAPAFTPQHLCCSIHAAALFRHSIDAVALTMPYLCSSIHVATCTQQHLCSSMHTAAFTLLSRRSIDAVALTLQHWCCRIYAAPSTLQNFSVAASRSESHVAAFSSSIYAATRAGTCTGTFTLQLSLGRSADGSGQLGAHFPTPSTTPAGGSRPRDGTGRGGAGGGFRKGVFWDGVGWGALCTYISPKGVCDEQGLRGVNLGKKRPIWAKKTQKSVKSGQKGL